MAQIDCFGFGDGWSLVRRTGPAGPVSVRAMIRALAFTAALLTSATSLAGCGGSDGSSTTSDESTTSTSTEKKAPEKVDAAPKPFNVSGLLKGDAKPTLPDGDAGKVAVIAQAPIDKDKDMGSAVLTFAFRNNTDKGISHVDFSATARADGKLVATGSSQGTQPAQVAPGEVGMGFIYFDAGNDIPATGATYDTAPLAVGEANRSGSKIVGSATNKTGKKLTGPYGAEAYCFDGDKITGQVGDFAEEDGDIGANATVNFTIDLYDTSCKTFAVGVSGFFA
jgi:hypothetical protein